MSERAYLENLRTARDGISTSIIRTRRSARHRRATTIRCINGILEVLEKADDDRAYTDHKGRDVVADIAALCRDARWMLATLPRRRRWKFIAHRDLIRARFFIDRELRRILGNKPLRHHETR